MNYHSIEFFKFYLRRLTQQNLENNRKGIDKTIKHMLNYVLDRELNNKTAYSTKFLKRLNFNNG